MELTKKFEPPKRSCDGCTMCCEGWLSASALGHTFYPGQPCHWVGTKGCTVYADRPPVCTGYECAWLSNHILPEWFKPSESSLIGTWCIWKDKSLCKEGQTGTYIKFIECDKPIDSKYLTWLNNYATAGLLNIKYRQSGIWHYMGDEDFVEWCASGEPPFPKPEAEVEEQEEEEAPVKLERARNADGTYKADDPSTPDVNEAWVEVKEDTTKPQ
jgi:hypothetical protein